MYSKFCFCISRQRAQEMWNWIYQLESEKFDFIEHMKHQKYEVSAKWYIVMKRTAYNVFLVSFSVLLSCVKLLVYLPIPIIPLCDIYFLLDYIAVNWRLLGFYIWSGLILFASCRSLCFWTGSNMLRNCEYFCTKSWNNINLRTVCVKSLLYPSSLSLSSHSKKGHGKGKVGGRWK